MAKADLIAEINALGIPGIIATEDLKVEQLDRILDLVKSESKLNEANDALIDANKTIKELNEKCNDLTKDVEKLNAELQKATDINAATGAKPTVNVDGKNYVINFAVKLGDTTYSIANIEKNVRVSDGGEGIADYLVKIESPALKLVG